MKIPKIKPKEETLCCIFCGMPLAIYRHKPTDFYQVSIKDMVDAMKKIKPKEILNGRAFSSR